MTTAVAISTTGDPHRMRLLIRCVEAWASSNVGFLFVTVDGSDDDAKRVKTTLPNIEVHRVGQPFNTPVLHGRLGVAANKNTGLELMMDGCYAEHLFLSDDDTWPLMPAALTKHTDLDLPHTMVAWGKHRHPQIREMRGNAVFGGETIKYASWSWPRGSMLYTHRVVVSEVGGMIEAFGAGGHEHVEWSRRIHQAGWTPAPYCSPASYAEVGVAGPGTRYSALWHAEDGPLPGEPIGNLRARRRLLTSVRRQPGDDARINAMMEAQDGVTDFVDYRAQGNGRGPATLYPSTTPRA